MSLIVQKFGGTSVANAEKIRAAARRAIRAQQEGNQVVMVVSAMGQQTDVLIDLAKQITDDPPAREMDMLLSTGEQVSVALMAMAIHALGAEAVSLTGGQIGIRTDSSHTKARIQSISTERMKKHLDDGKIVIAAGFQGIDEDFNITTLGRGGSDTTAVALAAVLRADACEIYTDVDGVFTTDPRLVAEARKMDRVSHDEMLELASLGAGVMHSRSIEFGKKFDVPIHVLQQRELRRRAGHGHRHGVRSRRPGRERRGAHQERSPNFDRRRARSTGHELRDLLEAGRRQRGGRHDRAKRRRRRQGRHLVHRAGRRSAEGARTPSKKAAEELGAEACCTTRACRRCRSSASAWPRKPASPTACSARWPTRSINIEAITTSEIKISVLVKREQALAALRAVHGEFELEKPPARPRGVRRQAARQPSRPTPSTSSPGCSGWKTSRSKASRSTRRRRR